LDSLRPRRLALRPVTRKNTSPSSISAACYVYWRQPMALKRGTLHVNGIKLTGGDAALLENESPLTLDASFGAEVLVWRTGSSPARRKLGGRHMWTSWQNPLALAGRILLALLFIPAGLGKLTGFAGSVAYTAAGGIPFPQVAVVAALLLEIVGGIALLLGWGTRWAALALALFALVASFFLHNYWSFPAEQASAQQMLFYKDLAVVGGLLAFAAFGPGSLSIDARQRNPHP
jgi:putative oxidoreductase